MSLWRVIRVRDVVFKGSSDGSTPAWFTGSTGSVREARDARTRSEWLGWNCAAKGLGKEVYSS